MGVVILGDELRRLANRVYNGERIGRERIGRERPVRGRPVRGRPVRERPVRERIGRERPVRGRPVIERRVIEIRKREEKGIYVEKSLDLLRGCSAGVLRIIYDEFPLVFNIKYTSEKLNFIALNYPTKDIENAIIRAEDKLKEKRLERERLERERLERERLERERLERERLEREEKGIYVDKSLDLLGGCSTEVIRVLYDKFDVSDIKQDPEKLNYIALNYPTQDIENAIIRAEDQIKREHILPYIIGVIIILILVLIFLSML